MIKTFSLQNVCLEILISHGKGWTILWSGHYKALGKFLKCRLLRKYEREQANYLNIFFTVRHSRWPICFFLPKTSPRGHSRLYEVKYVLASNFRPNRDRALGMVSMCFPGRGASTDMQRTDLGHRVNLNDLDRRPNSDLDL